MALSLSHILTSLCQPAPQLLSDHHKLLQCSSSPPPALHPYPSSPLPPCLTTILRLNIDDHGAAIALRSLTTPAYMPDYVQTVVEDTERSAIVLQIHPPTRLPEGMLFAISRPRFEFIGETIGFKVALCDLCVFPDTEPLPGIYSLGYILETVKELMGGGKAKLALGVGLRGWKRFGESEELVYQCATCYRHLGNYEKVVEMAGKLMEMTPGALPGQLLLCDALLCLNQLEQASSLLSHLSSSFPCHPQLIPLSQRLSSLRHSSPTPYCSLTRLSRLKELVLVEWPSNTGWEDLKNDLCDRGIPADRVSVSGKTAILYYPSIEKREAAREKIAASSEFILANAPAE